jgi:hypothetical protein
MMIGPQLLARTLSLTSRPDRYGHPWQYHSRSDHHSKVASWGLIFDLMQACPTLCRHIADGRVVFGINHEMRDFVQDRKKNLDLVICTPAPSALPQRSQSAFSHLVEDYGISLAPEEQDSLAALPVLRRGAVGSVLVALEAKACMTAHQRALPRLYDELNSSHLTVHAASDQAIAAGFAMVNAAARYLSPDLNKKNRFTDPEWSHHKQPRDAELAISKVRQLPRRSRPGETGYDAFGVVVIEMANDGSPVTLWTDPPAPQVGDIHHYAALVERMAHTYATRFGAL